MPPLYLTQVHADTRIQDLLDDAERRRAASRLIRRKDRSTPLRGAAGAPNPAVARRTPLVEACDQTRS